MDKGTYEPIGAAMTTKKISRRQVARGAAWAVPTVAVGAATPAWATSVLKCPAVEDFEPFTAPGTYEVVIPAGCANVKYTLAAGAGAEPTAGPSAGQGATATGYIVNSNPLLDWTLTVVIGAGGGLGDPNTLVAGGVGYGNGGDAGDPGANEFEGGNYTAGPVAAGGGGSAILYKPTPASPLTPLVVVGGGGGGKKGWASANSDGSCNETAVWNYRTIGNSGNGQAGPNASTDGVSSEDWICVDKAAADIKDYVRYIDLYAGQGAKGDTGGLGGVIDKTGSAVALPPPDVGPGFIDAQRPDPTGIIRWVAVYGVYGVREFNQDGGNHGTGNLGGGNGGHGALPWGGNAAPKQSQPGDFGRCVPGPGGGGGWAGGGGGSVWATAYQTIRTGCQRRETYSSGAGGGSSYLAAAADTPGITMTPVTWGLNGATDKTSPGKNGSGRLDWGTSIEPPKTP